MAVVDYPPHCAGCRCFEGRRYAIPSEPWQACPVCGGRGWMPHGFFTGMLSGTDVTNETCRVCGGLGMVKPSVHGNSTESEKGAK